MKRISTLVLAMLTVSFTVKAQFTLNSGDFPAAGETFQMMLADTTGFNPGAAGTGVTWNFTSAGTIFGNLTDSFMNVSQTPFAASYTGANLAVHEMTSPSTNTYIYFNKTGSSVDRIGSKNFPSGNTVIYSDPASQYNYPVSYGSGFADTYGGTYTTSSGSTGVKGAGSSAADGFGTLINTLGTFHNVMRVKDVRMETDTLHPAGTIVTIQETFYLWYQAGKYYPIMRYTKSDITSTVINQHISTLAYRMGDASPLGVAITGTEEAAIRSYLFPNPADENVTLFVEPGNQKDFTVNLFSMDGRQIKHLGETNGNDMPLLNMSMEDVTPGLYLVEIKGGGSRQYMKLQVVH